MDAPKQNYYNHGGIQRDVDPFMVQMSDLYLSTNFYTKHFGSKKVRFGYKKILDTVDNQPIRNLIYYDLIGSKGLLRYSNSKLYKWNLSGANWGSAIKTLTSDTLLANAQMMGSEMFLHFGNPTDGYFTYDGTNFINWAGYYTNKPYAMTAWQSRIFTDVNRLSLAESAISFDLNGTIVNGTVTVTNGSKTVTGSRTSFISQFGAAFGVVIGGVSFTVSAVSSDTSLTLTGNFNETTASGLVMYYADGETPFPGTVTATNGSTTITGSGTSFTTAFAVDRALLISGVVYNIGYVLSDTSLTLTSNYAGTNASGVIVYTSYSSDPFFANPNDPAGGGTTSITAGKDGRIVSMTSSVDRVNIYKQFGVYKFNGASFFRMPYFGNILSVCSTKDDIDYFFATNGIFRNDGKQISPADFGINLIIKDTLRVHGITNPIAFSFGDYTMFYVGTIRVGSGDQAIDINNGMFVHNDRYDQWDIWSLGDNMTAFGYYIDPTTNEPIMVSGDSVGNVYAWGEQYSSDNGKPIFYHLRTSYNHFGDPYSSKYPDRYAIAFDQGSNAILQVATNYQDDFGRTEQDNSPGFLTKDFFKGIRSFKTIAFQIMGSTTTMRPEFHGYSIGMKDMGDRVEYTKANRSKR